MSWLLCTTKQPFVFLSPFLIYPACCNAHVGDPTAEKRQFPLSDVPAPSIENPTLCGDKDESLQSQTHNSYFYISPHDHQFIVNLQLCIPFNQQLCVCSYWTKERSPQNWCMRDRTIVSPWLTLIKNEIISFGLKKKKIKIPMYCSF